MTSHVVVPALDPTLPATLSAPILALLRDRLGFSGVIVSDALDMAGASAARGIPEAAVLSIAAGADLLCIGAGNSVEQVRVDPGRARRRGPGRPARRGAPGRGGERSEPPPRFVCEGTCRSRRRVADESDAGRGRGAVGDRLGRAALADAAPGSSGSTRPAPSRSAPRPGACRPTTSSHRGRPTFRTGRSWSRSVTRTASPTSRPRSPRPAGGSGRGGVGLAAARRTDDAGRHRICTRAALRRRDRRRWRVIRRAREPAGWDR